VDKTLLIDPRDNVVVALQNLAPGAPLPNGITSREAVAAKHKAALVDLAPGDSVRMYGVTVGKATKLIRAGDRISTENIVHEAESFGNRIPAAPWTMPDVSRWAGRTFRGYRRANANRGDGESLDRPPDGLLREPQYAGHPGSHAADPRIGTAFRLRAIRPRFGKEASGGRADRCGIGGAGCARNRAALSNVDGVKFLTHQMGCGGTRGDARSSCALLAGYATHANVAGITVLSLGCQNAEVRMLEEEIAKRDPAFAKPFQVLVQQGYPSEEALISDAIRHIFSGLVTINGCHREPASLDELCLGMECGGSDGFSGISANPVLGQVSDYIVALGGDRSSRSFPSSAGWNRN